MSNKIKILLLIFLFFIIIQCYKQPDKKLTEIVLSLKKNVLYINNQRINMRKNAIEQILKYFNSYIIHVSRHEMCGMWWQYNVDNDKPPLIYTINDLGILIYMVFKDDNNISSITICFDDEDGIKRVIKVDGFVITKDTTISEVEKILNQKNIKNYTKTDWSKDNSPDFDCSLADFYFSQFSFEKGKLWSCSLDIDDYY